MKKIEKIIKWYQQNNSNNTTIKEAIRFPQLAEKSEQRNLLKF